MAALSDFRPKIIGHVPGCPEFLIEDAARDAAREYCKDTWVWQDGAGENEEIEVDPYEEQTVYDLTNEDDAVIIAVSAVLRNGTPMKPGIEYARAVKDARLVLSSPLSASDEVEVKRVHRPSATAAVIPDFLLEDHAGGIANRAIASLLTMAAKPWTDASKAMYHEGLYLAAVSEARAAAIKGGTNQSLAVYPRKFG